MDRHLPFLLPSAGRIMSDILKTPRLSLRPLETTDLGRLVALANNWAIARMLTRMPFPYGRAEGEAFLTGVAADPDEGTLAIVHPEGLIGMIGLHRQAARRHELGYWLGEPYWGRGFITEAARTLLGHAFANWGPPYATAADFEDNTASARVLQKLGFRYSGLSERDCLARGTKVESREMILDRTDWTPE